MLYCVQLLLTEALSTIKLSLENVEPVGIAATPSGALIATCDKTHSVYAIDPYTGHCERIAGTGSVGELKDGSALFATFRYPNGVVVVDSECSAYVCDRLNQAIRRLTLPPKYFWTRTTASSHALFVIATSHVSVVHY